VGRKERSGMAKRYWDDEEPTVAVTSKNVLRYFPGADELQVSRPDWENEDGETKPGKTVTVDLAALRANEGALRFFREIAKAGRC
jgi:hypothetical protein